MVKHNRLSQEAQDHIPVIVQQTKNFTGAEISGLVRSAASFALAKTIDAKNLSATDFNSVMVQVSKLRPLNSLVAISLSVVVPLLRY